jgi:large subunit ribosomal protein L13
MKTYSPKSADLTHEWYLLDASGQTLGRLASFVAIRLMGKHKAGFAAHVDGGDNVVVINAAQIKITGNKLENKKYYHHSGYPGGIKEQSLSDLIQKNPDAVIVQAVKGMLPKNRLLDDRLRRLKVYAGSEHAHAGQTPKPLTMSKEA